VNTFREERSGNTLYQEFSFQDPELVEEQTEVTGAFLLYLSVLLRRKHLVDVDS
jgi:hypothetical protein